MIESAMRRNAPTAFRDRAPKHLPDREPQLSISIKQLKIKELYRKRGVLMSPGRLAGEARGRLAPWPIALQDFDIPVTFCRTQEYLGLAPHPASAPIDPLHFADFCAEMTELHTPAPSRAAVA